MLENIIIIHNVEYILLFQYLVQLSSQNNISQNTFLVRKLEIKKNKYKYVEWLICVYIVGVFAPATARKFDIIKLSCFNFSW